MEKVQDLESKIKELEREIQWRDNYIKEINEDNLIIIAKAVEATELIKLYDKFIKTMNLHDELKQFVKEEEQTKYN